MPPHGDFGFCAENRFFKFQSNVFAQIGAALGAAASATAAAKHIAEAKEVPKDIAEVLENGRVKASRTGTGASHSGVAETVISGAFVSVGENRVGLAAFLELFFRIRIIGIAIRMIGQREFAISAFDFLFGGSAANSQHLVVVAFSVTGQNGPSSNLPELLCETYRLGLRATFTMEGRSSRSFSL